MPLKLSLFEIAKLHGRRSIRLTLEDNRLILVGENGSGKTTLINFLYFFLSRQWHRLAQYDFHAVRAVLNDVEIEVSKELIVLTADHPRNLYGHMPNRLFAELKSLVLSEGRAIDDKKLFELGRTYGYPESLMHSFLVEIGKTQMEHIDRLQQKNETIRRLVVEQILYLPTYRRIEQDLKSIFPNMDESGFREKVGRRRAPAGVIELVEFGMEDVEKSVKNKMDQLKENNRTGLTSLAITYLREVIGGEYRHIKAGSIESMELKTIESIFSRIDEKMLPNTAKDRLRSIVTKIQAHQSVEEEGRVIALFLLKLLELHRSQQEFEKNVNTFVETCNKYLVGKKLKYDSNNFTISIELLADRGARNSEVSTIELQDLSSGEKQIVSLFSHLLLSDVPNVFILIDEPELSLSVPWQHTFLPDILSTQRCNGLVAVTHSPFIFANELDRYGHNLNEYWI
jgi:ABC-type molybdenum transport system ATPase subunit/photorepair protein PhrA